MEREENLENLPEPDEMKEELTMEGTCPSVSIVLLIGVAEEEPAQVEPIPSVHKQEERGDKENGEDEEPLSDSSSPEDQAAVTATPFVELDKPPLEEPSFAPDIEDTVLAHPTPQHPSLTNPRLKSVNDEMPPTPRHSSPLQIALEQIHPSNPKGEDHRLTSPTERKEEAVQLPTEVCEFPVLARDASSGAEASEIGIHSLSLF